MYFDQPNIEGIEVFPAVKEYEYAFAYNRNVYISVLR
jgi:hypothetical protein